MVAIKDEEGNILARRILRLLTDEKTGKPILYKDGLYMRPGLSDADLAALETMCAERAQKLGVTMVQTPSPLSAQSG